MITSWGIDQFQSTVINVTNNVYRVRLFPLPAKYYDGMNVRFTATEDSTGQLFVNLLGQTTNTLGAIPVVRPDGTATISGDALEGQVVSVIYLLESNTFQLHSTPAYIPPDRFTSALNAIPGASSVLTIAHGLGSKPLFVRAVLQRVAGGTAIGYSVGDEVDLEDVHSNGTTSNAFVVTCDTINIYVTEIATAGVYQLPNRGGGAYTNITAANWNIKVYASL